VGAPVDREALPGLFDDDFSLRYPMTVSVADRALSSGSPVF